MNKNKEKHTLFWSQLLGRNEFTAKDRIDFIKSTEKQFTSRQLDVMVTDESPDFLLELLAKDYRLHQGQAEILLSNRSQHAEKIKKLVFSSSKIDISSEQRMYGLRRESDEIQSVVLEHHLHLLTKNQISKFLENNKSLNISVAIASSCMLDDRQVEMIVGYSQYGSGALVAAALLHREDFLPTDAQYDVLKKSSNQMVQHYLANKIPAMEPKKLKDTMGLPGASQSCRLGPL